MLVTKEPPVQIFNTPLMEKEQITDQEYLNLFDMISLALEQMNKLKENQIFIQEKLSYLKKRIESISNSQDENLLLYQLQFAYYKLKQNYDKISIENYEQFILEGEKVLPILISRVRLDLNT